MRPYQRAAVDFFMTHPHSILADEMGTGKTLQAIATVQEARCRASYFAETETFPGTADLLNQPILVVCPNSLRGTWADEIDGWTDTPEARVQIIDGKNPTKRRAQADADADYFVVNWEKLRLMPELAKKSWGAVIADEAHRAKNRKAQQTKALWKLKAPIQLALTGTPIMSSPAELWSILRWLRPEQYTGYWPFHYSYVDEYNTAWGAVVTGVKNPDQLRFELADKLVRRTKRDVLKDLPPKTHVHIPVDLKPAQRRLYDEATTALLLDIKEVLADQPDKAEQAVKAAEAGDVKAFVGLIPHGAARIMRQRQIASTPALLGGPDESGKFDAAEEIIRDNPGRPFVVFTWFADSARIMAQRLAKGKPKLRVATIAGDDDPDPIKDAFQNGDLDVVVCTIAKGGVGLTLTRADTAIFIERDWTPAINSQAEDRLHRIGQDNPVTIYVIEARDTIDVNKIAPANRLKELIAAQVLGDPED
jgi:SNF2 family DNA or RNA helicase